MNHIECIPHQERTSTINISVSFCFHFVQVAMVGLDQFITKNATLADEKADDAHTIKAMKFSVSPVVRVAVETKVRCLL